MYGPDDDKKFISEVARWPNYPVLPLKRHQDGEGNRVSNPPEVGVLFVRGFDASAGYLWYPKGNLWEPPASWGDGQEKTEAEALAMVDDGWMVD